MAQVKFAKTWFGPDGFRYRAGVQEVPSKYLELIPSSASVVEVPKAVEEEKPVAKTAAK